VNAQGEGPEFKPHYCQKKKEVCKEKEIDKNVLYMRKEPPELKNSRKVL
jgi:hypothetical protein